MNQEAKLKDRLHDAQVCSPAQNYCRNRHVMEEAANRIEMLEEKLKVTVDDAKEAEDYAEELEAKLAKAVVLLGQWINVTTHCTIEEGVCCCGDNMDTHAEPMICGHSPVDHGAYVASCLVEETNAILAELTGGQIGSKT